MKKNSPKVWDNVWNMYTPEYLKFLVENEKKMLKYRRIMGIVKKHFGSDLSNVKCIEIGAGIGTYSIYLAQMGASVTILDYSAKALNQSKKIFKMFGLKATFVNADALKLPASLEGGFDLSLSFGLCEHFSGESRTKIFKSHTELLRKNGLFIAMVPNSLSMPYRIFMTCSKLINQWPYGEEYPFGAREIKKIMGHIGQKNYSTQGDGILNSLDFLNGFRLINKKLTLRHSKPFQVPTFLDKPLSYCHIIYGER